MALAVFCISCGWRVDYTFSVRVVLVYDVGEERIPLVYGICRRYLHWVQNSVFEGELTEGKLNSLMRELEGILDSDDSIVIYVFKEGNLLGRVRSGPDAQESEFIL